MAKKKADKKVEVPKKAPAKAPVKVTGDEANKWIKVKGVKIPLHPDTP